MQVIGRPSLGPGDCVQDVAESAPQLRAWPHAMGSVEVGRFAFQSVIQPASNDPLLLSTRPLPPLRCVWTPLPGCGRQPALHAFANARKRPTVTSYLSSAKVLTVAG